MIVKRSLAWFGVILLLLCPTVFAEMNDASLTLPIGDANPASAWMFTGQSYIYPLVENDSTWNAPGMMNVTFEPCARTDWHSHDGGQILIAVGGIGIHQIEGEPPELLTPGSVARVAPGVLHWHGAADAGWFQHIAIETNPDQTGFAMGESIEDDAYFAALDEAMAADASSAG